MASLLLYCLFVLLNFGALSIFALLFTFVALLAHFAHILAEGFSFLPKVWEKVLYCVFGISLIVSMLVPTKEEMFTIWIAPKIVNNEKLQALPNNALEYLNVFFKEEIGKLKENGVK